MLRGARQVGKTSLVRDAAQRAQRDLVELNFERDPGHARAFAGNDPKQVLGELSLLLDRDLAPGRSLLFLDEIQAAGAVLAKLRWFAEELPQLPVIAAGSLLEFALADHGFSMPVGRVGFLHLEPMGFDEYLRAHGETRLLAALVAWHPGEPLSPTAHSRALDWFHRYAMVGGMPAVVAADVAGESPRACRGLQRDLLATFRADFARYAGRMDRTVLDHVLEAVARSLGRKALLLGGDPTGNGPRLFYWQREGGRPGEIDFVLQASGHVVPVEIKSGATGAMKGLHQFMFDKRLRLAVRIDDNPPSLAKIEVSTTQGDPVRYQLLGLPIYLAWRAIDAAAAIAR